MCSIDKHRKCSNEPHQEELFIENATWIVAQQWIMRKKMSIDIFEHICIGFVLEQLETEKCAWFWMSDDWFFGVYFMSGIVCKVVRIGATK